MFPHQKSPFTHSPIPVRSVHSSPRFTESKKSDDLQKQNYFVQRDGPNEGFLIQTGQSEENDSHKFQLFQNETFELPFASPTSLHSSKSQLSKMTHSPFPNHFSPLHTSNPPRSLPSNNPPQPSQLAFFNPTYAPTRSPFQRPMSVKEDSVVEKSLQKKNSTNSNLQQRTLSAIDVDERNSNNEGALVEQHTPRGLQQGINSWRSSNQPTFNRNSDLFEMRVSNRPLSDEEIERQIPNLLHQGHKLSNQNESSETNTVKDNTTSQTNNQASLTNDFSTDLSDSQTFMCVVFHNKKIGLAFYDDQSNSLTISETYCDGNEFDLIQQGFKLQFLFLN